MQADATKTQPTSLGRYSEVAVYTGNQTATNCNL